jgi:hypothetical protein
MRVVTESDMLDKESSDKEKVGEKYGKGATLNGAVDYIIFLDGCAERLGNETLVLQA